MNEPGKTSVTAYLKGISQLIRLPNLLIIVLTQFLLRYAILKPMLFRGTIAASTTWIDFCLLVMVTLLIAVAGYVINDYFDVKIDRVNKPERLVIDRQITARMAIMIHLVLNGMATILGFYLAYRVKSFYFGLIFPFIGVLLWLYSARYKRTLLWGNIIVAFLSAFVILIVWLFEFFHLRLDVKAFAAVISDLKWVTYLFLAYALFAFLLTVCREIVKDMEDMEGDEQYGCRTLPLVIGRTRSGWAVILLMVINMVLLTYGMIVLYRLNMMMAFWYFACAVQIPVLFHLYLVLTAKAKGDYHAISTLTKFIMLAGILSMQVISLNF